MSSVKRAEQQPPHQPQPIVHQNWWASSRAPTACHMHGGQLATLNTHRQTRLGAYLGPCLLSVWVEFVEVEDGSMDRKLAPSPSESFRFSAFISRVWTSYFQLCAFIHFFADCHQTPLDPPVGDVSEPFPADPAPSKGRSSRRYMKGQEVKNWVCRVSLHLKGRLTVIEAGGHIRLCDCTMTDRMGGRGRYCLSVIKGKLNSAMAHRI